MADREKLTHATASDAAPDINVSRDRRRRRMFSAQTIFEPLGAMRGSLIPSLGRSGWQQGARPGRSARRCLYLESCERAWPYDEAFPRQAAYLPLDRQKSEALSADPGIIASSRLCALCRFSAVTKPRVRQSPTYALLCASFAENLPAFSIQVTAARCRLSTFWILAARFSMLSSSRSKDPLFIQAHAGPPPSRTSRSADGHRHRGWTVLNSADFQILQPVPSVRRLRDDRRRM